MVNEARIVRFAEFIEPDGILYRVHSRGYTHEPATEVEAIVGAVFAPSLGSDQGLLCENQGAPGDLKHRGSYFCVFIFHDHDANHI